MDEISEEIQSKKEKYYILGVEVSYEEMDRLSCEQANGKELKVIDSKVVAVDHEVSKEEHIRNQINNLLIQLAATDYIVLKITEAETEEEKQALREKYAKQLNNRKFWREQINSLENQLKF
jgi:malonyl CoA-acyl carrier protein transacylase